MVDPPASAPFRPPGHCLHPWFPVSSLPQSSQGLGRGQLRPESLGLGDGWLGAVQTGVWKRNDESRASRTLGRFIWLLLLR